MDNESLGEQLDALQRAQVASGRRAMILFEGPDGAGKKAALRGLSAAFDPCYFAVHRTTFDRREAADGHWLARFWRQLPGAGQTCIFFRSWYRRVLDERLAGRVDDGLVARAFDEINEFEAQQRDYGTLIVKLYFDVSEAVQAQRLAERDADPWPSRPRWEEPLLVNHPAYASAMRDVRKQTDTRWSPWVTIDGDDQQRACRAALEAIASSWADAMPAEPTHLVSTSPRAA